MRKRGPKWSTITIALAVIAAVAVASPALGGPSLRSLVKKVVKKEVTKQISKASGPAGATGGAGAQGPGALRFDFDQPETDNTLRPLGTQNELTFKARCKTASGNTLVELLVNSSVAAEISVLEAESAASLNATVQNQAPPLTAGADQQIVSALPAITSQSATSNSVASYRNANRVITLNIHMVADDVIGRCKLYGTAVPAS
jgi:hypothetical protein